MRLSSVQTAIASLLLAMGATILFFSVSTPAAAGEIKATDSESVMPEEPKMPEIVQAAEDFKDRDIDGCLKNLKAAYKKNAEIDPPQVSLALWYIQSKDMQKGLLAFESAVKDDPTDPGAYVWLARIDLDNRHITEAGLLLDKANALLANFTKSEKRKNDLTAAVADGLALVAEYREDWPTAQKYLEIWLKQDPKNTKALTRMARVIFQQKTPQSSQQALEKLREAQKLDPKNVLTAEARLAMFFQQADDLDNAKKYMAAALTANPKDLPTLLYAAQFSLENGQYDDAKERATAALGIQPDPKLSEAKLQEFRDQMLSAKILRGLVARVQKDWKAAATYFEDAHLQAPGNFLASNNLALVLIEQDDKSKSKQQMALGYAQNNAQQYTNTQNAPEAASTYGRVMYKLGKLDEAAKALRQAVSASNDPDTYYFYAVVANELGNKEEARKYLKASLKSKATIFVMKQEASTLLEKINE